MSYVFNRSEKIAGTLLMCFSTIVVCALIALLAEAFKDKKDMKSKFEGVLSYPPPKVYNRMRTKEEIKQEYEEMRARLDAELEQRSNAVLSIKPGRTVTIETDKPIALEEIMAAKNNIWVDENGRTDITNIVREEIRKMVKKEALND